MLSCTSLLHYSPSKPYHLAKDPYMGMVGVVRITYPYLAKLKMDEEEEAESDEEA